MDNTTERHCGGCGWSHARGEVFLADAPMPVEELLAAAGVKRGHVAYFGDAATAVAVGRCTRDVREVATEAFTNVFCLYYSGATEEEQAMEDYYEKIYATSYGLGL